MNNSEATCTNCGVLYTIRSEYTHNVQRSRFCEFCLLSKDQEHEEYKAYQRFVEDLKCPAFMPSYHRLLKKHSKRFYGGIDSGHSHYLSEVCKTYKKCMQKLRESKTIFEYNKEMKTIKRKFNVPIKWRSLSACFDLSLKKPRFLVRAKLRGLVLQWKQELERYEATQLAFTSMWFSIVNKLPLYERRLFNEGILLSTSILCSEFFYKLTGEHYLLEPHTKDAAKRCIQTAEEIIVEYGHAKNVEDKYAINLRAESVIDSWPRMQSQVDAMEKMLYIEQHLPAGEEHSDNVVAFLEFLRQEEAKFWDCVEEDYAKHENCVYEECYSEEEWSGEEQPPQNHIQVNETCVHAQQIQIDEHDNNSVVNNNCAGYTPSEWDL